MNQEKRFMQTVDPVEPNEVNISRILHGTRDITVVVEPPDDIDVQELDDNSQESDEDTSQHDVDDDNETYNDKDAEAEAPADVGIMLLKIKMILLKLKATMRTNHLT